MSDLAYRERQCFMMYHVDGLSEYIPHWNFNLEGASYKSSRERAKEKIEKAKDEKLVPFRRRCYF
jgi:hypothetical protein